MEEKEASNQDYFKNFIKQVIKDLKKEGRSYVYNRKQLEEVNKRIKVKVEREDNLCIWLKKV